MTTLKTQSEKARSYKEFFKKVFKVDVENYIYKPEIYGFRLLLFDSKIAKPKDNESIADAVKRKFGIKALAVLQDIITTNYIKKGK